jgi:3-hydroxyacyl-CoA dehydrogenase
MLANFAADAVAQQVASAADIDTAMRLGTNYPLGPLAWADRWGASVIVAVLDAMAAYYGDGRYRASALLRRAVLSGGHWHETDTEARRVSERVNVRRDGAVWWVGLARPQKRNALDQAMVEELGGVLAQARREPSILIVHSATLCPAHSATWAGGTPPLSHVETHACRRS